MSFLITLFSLKFNLTLKASSENFFQKGTSSTSNRPQEKREGKDQSSPAPEISDPPKKATNRKEENLSRSFFKLLRKLQLPYSRIDLPSLKGLKEEPPIKKTKHQKFVRNRGIF